MDKASNIATVCSYAMSCGSGGFWLYRLLNSFTADQWIGIGVIGSLFFTALTWLTNILFKLRADKAKQAAKKGE